MITVLTVLEPWATLIADGSKFIETRSWKTPYRGPLAIHSGKNLEHVYKGLDFGYNIDTLSEFAGCVVAMSELVDIISSEDASRKFPGQIPYGDFSPGRWCWILAGVTAIDEPIPIRGQRGLWVFDELKGAPIGRH